MNPISYIRVLIHSTFVERRLAVDSSSVVVPDTINYRNVKQAIEYLALELNEQIHQPIVNQRPN